VTMTAERRTGCLSTSGSGTDGDPDEVADQVSAAVADAALAARDGPGAVPGR